MNYTAVLFVSLSSIALLVLIAAGIYEGARYMNTQRSTLYEPINDGGPIYDGDCEVLFFCLSCACQSTCDMFSSSSPVRASTKVRVTWTLNGRHCMNLCMTGFFKCYFSGCHVRVNRRVTCFHQAVQSTLHGTSRTNIANHKSSNTSQGWSIPRKSGIFRLIHSNYCTLSIFHKPQTASRHSPVSNSYSVEMTSDNLVLTAGIELRKEIELTKSTHCPAL